MRAAIAVACLWLAACGSTTAMVEAPRIVTVEAPRIVQVMCRDARATRQSLPSKDGVAKDDFEQIDRIAAATIQILLVWLEAAEAQIKACTGE